MDWTKIGSVVGAVVTCASVLANVIPPYTIVGKVLHFIALNWANWNTANASPSASASSRRS